MKFWEAMKVMEDGVEHIRRKEWSRVDYVTVRQVMFMEIDIVTTIKMVSIIMKDGKVGPYTPSNCDMMADDWVVVE